MLNFSLTEYARERSQAYIARREAEGITLAPEVESQWVTVDEAASITGATRNQIASWRSMKQIEGRKVIMPSPSGPRERALVEIGEVMRRKAEGKRSTHPERNRGKKRVFDKPRWQVK